MTDPRGERGSSRPSAPTQGGFSLLELSVVLLVVAVLTGISLVGFGEYARRTAPRRAAEVFVRDLRVARAVAVGERYPVAIVFDEPTRIYQVRMDDGDPIISRDFGEEAEFRLSAIDLEVDSDSLVFNERGFLNFSGVPGSLATARFEAGGRIYRVSLNASGTAEVIGP